MKAKKLRFLSQTLNIVSVEIPGREQLTNILGVGPALQSNDEWWVVNYAAPSLAFYVNINGLFKQADPTNIKGIKPIIIFKNKAYDMLINNEILTLSYKIGDKLLVGRNIFKIIGVLNENFVALCEVPIEYSAYDKSTQPVNYSQSELCAKFKEWRSNLRMNTTFNESTLKAHIIIPEDDIEISVKAAEIPHIHMLNYMPNVDQMCSCRPFWLYSRKDEYTGYRYERRRMQETGLTTPLSVFPVLILQNKEVLNTEELMFMIKGYVFRKLTDDTLMCISPVGISCYSTGLDYNESETSFYESSEINEIVQQWYEKLSV